MAADTHYFRKGQKTNPTNNSFRGFVFFKKNAIVCKNSNGGIMSKQDNSISFAMGLLGGVLGGIVAGILFAPKAGDETRAEIKDCITNFAQKHAPQISNAKKQAMESIDLVKYKLEQQYNKINDAIKAKNLKKAKEKEYPAEELN